MPTFLATSFGLAVALNVQALPIQYVPVDLGAIPSGFVVYSGKGPNINFAGQLAGATGLPDVRAATYDSQAQSLTVIPGVEGFRSLAQGINEQGEVT